ncbi:chromate transporter [Acidisphaera sp. L21]|jgi:chromate transporter|uniref:chromate transporter n=1 Tax=Acidisphaera sp. L21 TaxID=1641851 RepID=UPI00131C33C5|nr:chromate transporter [Acidisphaera sp. L21]
MSELGHLLGIFGQLSVLAVGGVAPTLPEMQRQVVDVHRYMDRTTFAALFALAQAAPGPNMMVSTLIGWRVAGLPGAIVATVGMIGPSSVLTFSTVQLWHRFRERAWRRVVQAGLVPVTVGLVGAGAALLASSTTHGLVTAGITLVTAAVLTLTKMHPLAMLAIGAVAGALLA